MTEAQEGMSDMPALNPIDDDGDTEEVIDEEEPDQLPVDESDTDDDEDADEGGEG